MGAKRNSNRVLQQIDNIKDDNIDVYEAKKSKRVNCEELFEDDSKIKCEPTSYIKKDKTIKWTILSMISLIIIIGCVFILYSKTGTVTIH